MTRSKLRGRSLPSVPSLRAASGGRGLQIRDYAPQTFLPLEPMLNYYCVSPPSPHRFLHFRSAGAAESAPDRPRCARAARAPRPGGGSLVVVYSPNDTISGPMDECLKVTTGG